MTGLLPADGFRGEIPDPEFELSESGHAHYVRLWRTPEASQWEPWQGPLLVHELAHLHSLVDDKLAAGDPVPEYLYVAIGDRASRLGFGHESANALDWHVIDDPFDMT